MSEGPPMQGTDEEGYESDNFSQGIFWGLILAIAIIGGAVISYMNRGAVQVDAPLAKCILQMNTMEKLMVSYGNLNGIKPGDEVAPSVLVDDGYISRLMTCPAGGYYTYSGRMPTMETGSKPYTQCDIEDHFIDPWPDEEK